MAWFRKEQDSAGDEEVPREEPLPRDKSSSRSPADEWYLTLKRRLHQEVVAAIDIAQMRALSDDELRDEMRRKATALARQDPDLRKLPERDHLIEQVLDESFGYGPIEDLMQDPEVSDILINGPRQLFVERRGRLYASDVAFHDEDHLMHILQRVVATAGRRIDENSPIVDARLPDGSRLNAVIKPLALNGPLVSIRRFGARPLMADDLLKHESLTPEMLDFLAGCVQARVNIIISGGAGSGKTTLLNCLSRYIPRAERIATIEDAAELMLQQPHVAKMETRPANPEGGRDVTMRDLVRNSLRMRPDRIIVGECRGSEAMDMLQAMNTGHEGSLTTIHANTPRDAVTRLEMMVGMSFDLPVWVIRKQIASSVNLVVQVSRVLGGKRKVISISEITGIQTDVVMMHQIFEFVQTGVDEEQSAIGYFQATGLRPECLEKLIANGVNLPMELFEERRLFTVKEQEQGA